MIRRIIIPLLAVAGVIFAIVTVITGNRPTPAAPAATEPSASPFASYIAGAGIVESRYENIPLGTLVAGVVSDIFVKVGDNVKKGDRLWQMDDRELRAGLMVKQAAYHQQAAQLHKMEQGTRPEELPGAQALVDADKVLLEDAKTQYARYAAVSDAHAVSQDDITHRRFAVAAAAAHLAQSEASLTLLKAGSWSEDLAIARANVQASAADVDAAKVLIDRLLVRAPADGQILQINTHLGQYAPAGNIDPPLMLMGDVSRLVVRTDIDENDASRFASRSPARAYLRGNANIFCELTYLRTQPYVIPKKSLTGDSTERVDTRVLQALYLFDRGDKSIFVGQQMDVFIEAPALGQSTASVSSTKP